MKKKGSVIQNGRRWLNRAVVAGAGLMLAAVLIPAPDAGETSGAGFPFVQTAEAETLSKTSGKCGDNAGWTFDPSTGTLTIKGKGDMYDYDGTTHGDSPFMKKTNIKKVVISSGITSVGIATFYDCDYLKSVEMPKSLERIGKGAFQHCDSLTSVTLNSGLKLIGGASFRFCSSLSSVTISSTVEEIEYDAFLGTALKTVTVPGSVKKIGNSAFANNPALESLYLGEGVETIGAYMIRKTGITSIILPSTVTDVARGIALDNEKLEEIQVDWGNEYFYSRGGSLISYKDPGCLVYVPRAMSGVYYVPDCVTHFGTYAFCDNEKITEIVFLPGYGTVRSFDGTDTFRNCKSLKKFTIPKTVEWIGAEDGFGYSSVPYMNIFEGCTALEEIAVEQGNPYYTSVDGVLYTKDKKVLLSYPIGRKDQVFQIPKGVEQIAENAFRDGQYLNRIVMNDDLRKIGYGAFADCTELATMVISPKVSELENYQFEGCTKLKHLVFLNRGDTKLDLREDSGWTDFPSDFALYTYADATINGKRPSAYVSANGKAPNYSLPLVDGKNVFVSSGRTETLVPPTGATETTWKNLSFSINDPKVLKVSSGGVVTPLQEGKTTELYAFAKGGAVRYYASTGFSDVKSTDYYHDAVYWAYDNGITGGIKDSRGLVTTFDPQGTCTRGQMISFLWRMAGCPEPSGKTTVFTDLDPKAYYYKAVLWGVEQKIVGGYSDKTFRPQGICTRSQAVTFLWRYYGSPAPSAKNSAFSDVKDRNAYYYKAVLWANENGITGGYSDGTFRLNGECSRAQMVTFLYRSRSTKKK